MANSLRFLTLNHAQKIKAERVAAEKPPKEKGKDEDLPLLEHIEDGQRRLYSYFSPGLGAGDYVITAKQKIELTGPRKNEKPLLPEKIAEKQFTVDAAQFSLADGCVHSVNPAEGEPASAETLASIVFNDAHTPWGRISGVPDDPQKFERMPRLALLVFSANEIILAPEHLSGENSIFKGTKLAADTIAANQSLRQGQTFTINTSLSDFVKIKNHVESPMAIPENISKDEEKMSNIRTDLLFVKPGLFNKMITTYEKGTPMSEQKRADISRYKYLAHIRHVKTSGMAASATYETGIFSVVVAHRLGPLSNTEQGLTIAHLVSLDGWKNMPLVEADSTKYVALSSLYSWTYTTLPTSSPSLSELFRLIGNTSHVLRAPDPMIQNMAGQAGSLAKKMTARFKDGYTLVKHRTQTGETTSAFFRGALVPNVPTHPVASNWTTMSNSGTDLQILDQETGLLDITYSAAWNLGKAMAIADSSFTSSLARLRNYLLARALNTGEKIELQKQNAVTSRLVMLSNKADSIMTLHAVVNETDLESVRPIEAARWRANINQKAPDLTFANVNLEREVEAAVDKKARNLAGTAGKNGGEDKDNQILFNGLNTPYSTEWMVVLSWILDRMYLFGIPPQYLISDQAFVPKESLRFFHVDPNWIDCFVDGALSLSNSVSQSDNFIRRSMKGAINAYLDTTMDDVGYKPQIPSYGFFLRSDIVTQFPDLRIEAPINEGPEKDRAPILRHELMGDGLLLCLLDRSPEGEQLTSLSFKQPPYQQTFAACHKITMNDFTIRVKRQYSVKQQNNLCKFETFPETTMSPNDETKLFLWGENNDTRFLLMDDWIAYTLAALKTGMRSNEFAENTPATSALVGFQLGTAVYNLEIRGELSNLQSLAAPVVTRSLKLLRAPLSTLAAHKLLEKDLE